MPSPGINTVDQGSISSSGGIVRTDVPSAISGNVVYNPNYRVTLVQQAGENNNPKIIVVANCPESIGIRIQSEWESMASTVMGLLPNVAQAAAGLTLNVGGIAILPQFLTAQLWRGTSPLEFEIPLYFNAYNDALVDVVTPVRDLIRMISPYRTATTLASILGTTANAAINTGGNLAGASGFISAITSDNFILHAPGPTPKEFMSGSTANQISLWIGRALFLPSVVLTSLQIEWNSRYTTAGYPISAVCNVGIRSHFTYARDDYLAFVFPQANT